MRRRNRSRAEHHILFPVQFINRGHALESGGDLGDNDDYTKVIESDAAQTVMFVNFDADDNWLARVTEEMPEVSKNVEPLSAFGISGWVDGDVMHGLFKLTTD